jgi:pyridoxine kinase
MLHERYRIPHVLITSIALPTPGAEPSFFVVGSTFTSASTPRIFEVKIPAIDCFFSGTGDMFAALMLVRLREAVWEVDGLKDKAAWVSDDDVQPADLPLARATEKVLASMHGILTKTKEKRDAEIEKYNARVGARDSAADEKAFRLAKSKAAEVRLVRNLDALKNPDVKFRAENF